MTFAGIFLLAYGALVSLAIVLIGFRSAMSMLRNPKHREGLSERFGRVRPEFAMVAASRRVVWIHAVSVGEVIAASQLVKDLGNELGEESVVLVSTVTDTGQALARQKFGADRVFYAPIDFGFSVRTYLNALQPAAIVLIESGVWPRMMHECDKRSIPIIAANARVSDRTFKHALRTHGLWARWLRRATLWLAQTDRDANRLVQMGVPRHLVQITGNLKYDIRAPCETYIAQRIRDAAGTRPIIVAGSTVESNGILEESIVLQAWRAVSTAKLDSLLVLAPRHPERFKAVESLLAHYPYMRASDCISVPLGSRQPDVVLLDTIGDLSHVYSVAYVAFVGGSLVTRGGHNPLEPAQFGVPTLIGPSFENFHSVVSDMTLDDAVRVVGDESELAKSFIRLLTERELHQALGERARKFVEIRRGATACTVNAVLSCIGGIDACGRKIEHASV